MSEVSRVKSSGNSNGNSNGAIKGEIISPEDAVPIYEPQTPFDHRNAEPGEFVTAFQAWVKKATVGIKGDVTVELAVPMEHKYAALLLTDFQGIMFVIQVNKQDHITVTPEEIREWVKNNVR